MLSPVCGVSVKLVPAPLGNTVLVPPKAAAPGPLLLQDMLPVYVDSGEKLPAAMAALSVMLLVPMTEVAPVPAVVAAPLVLTLLMLAAGLV